MYNPEKMKYEYGNKNISVIKIDIKYYKTLKCYS